MLILRLQKTCFGGVIEGAKRLFSSHFVPFSGQIAGLFSLKKPSSGKKIALFSHFADPPKQV
jgi:hypothetical protein